MEGCERCYGVVGPASRRTPPRRAGHARPSLTGHAIVEEPAGRMPRSGAGLSPKPATTSGRPGLGPWAQDAERPDQ